MHPLAWTLLRIRKPLSKAPFSETLLVPRPSHHRSTWTLWWGGLLRLSFLLFAFLFLLCFLVFLMFGRLCPFPLCDSAGLRAFVVAFADFWETPFWVKLCALARGGIKVAERREEMTIIP